MAPHSQGQHSCGRWGGGHGCTTWDRAGGSKGGSVTPAQIRLNRNICAAGERGDVSTVLNLVHLHKEKASLVNLSTAWHCLARKEAEISGACQFSSLDVLQEHTRRRLLDCLAHGKEEPQPRCVSTIAWSCAKLQVTNTELLSVITNAALQWMTLFKPFELANVLWGMAKLQLGLADGFFSSAHDYIIEHASLFSTRSLSMVAWAFATIRFKSCRGLMYKMANAFASGLQDEGSVNPVTVTKMVWALATARVNVRKETLLHVADAAVGVLRAFKAPELSITLWAFARLSCCHERLFTQAAQLLCTSPHLQEDIHSQGIANLLWAFARHAQACYPDGQWHASSSVLTHLLPTCIRLLPNLRPVELASSVWAISRLAVTWGREPAADRILEAMAEILIAQPSSLEKLSPHGMGCILNAYCQFFSNQECPAPMVCNHLMMQLSALGVAQQLEPEELDSSPGGDQILGTEERSNGRHISGSFDLVQFTEKQSLPLPMLVQSLTLPPQTGVALHNIGPPPGLELKCDEGQASAANTWDLMQPPIQEPAYIKSKTSLTEDLLDCPERASSYLDECALQCHWQMSHMEQLPWQPEAPTGKPITTFWGDAVVPLESFGYLGFSDTMSTCAHTEAGQRSSESYYSDVASSSGWSEAGTNFRRA